MQSHLFKLLFTEFVLPLLRLQEAAELFLLLHLDVLLELLLVVGKSLKLFPKDKCAVRKKKSLALQDFYMHTDGCRHFICVFFSCLHTSLSKAAWCFFRSFSISWVKLFLWLSSSLSNLSRCSSISPFSLFSRAIRCF